MPLYAPFSLASLVGQAVAAASFTATGLVQAGTTLGISTDVLLARDAAAVLAQRNSTNAQAFRVYNTYTDASNGEWGTFNWTTVANRLTIGPVAQGTGTLRSIGLTSHVLWNTDNTYDIGASGATRPRTLYVGTSVICGGNVQAQSTGYLLWNGRSTMASPSDGVITLADAATSTFSRLQFGGTTSSFPALKRSSAALETRLADDSAYAQHNMQITALVDGITAPSATSGLAKIYVDTADGDLKVIFGDGTIKTIVVDT